MLDNSFNLREQLLNAQEMTPALRDACHKELAAMFEPTLTPRMKYLFSALLILMIVFVVIGIRALLFHYPGPFLYGVWIAFTVASAGGALWIGGALWRGRFLRASYDRVADAFSVMATVITVLTLGMGLNEPANPTYLFSALYALSFFGTCIAWSLRNRIAAAELAAREYMLRMECRLVELAGRLPR